MTRELKIILTDSGEFEGSADIVIPQSNTILTFRDAKSLLKYFVRAMETRSQTRRFLEVLAFRDVFYALVPCQVQGSDWDLSVSDGVALAGHPLSPGAWLKRCRET